MQIEQNKHDQHLEVRLTGRLDAQQAGVVDLHLGDAVRRGEHRIRLHMAAVPYMSSAGIRILLKYFRTLRGLGGGFVVIEPSEMVRSILEMAGLADMLFSGKTERPVEEGGAASTHERSFGAIRCTVHPGPTATPLSCRLTGNPDKLANGRFEPADITRLTLPSGTFSLGLGAFGQDYAECKDRFGEYLAVDGAAAYLPTDGSKLPDYMVTRGSLVPKIQTLYGITCSGELSQCVRFEVGGETGEAPFSQLAEAVLSLLSADTAGLVMIAETAGIVGAALRRSPGVKPAEEALFDHPGLREWLSFAPERHHGRNMVLAAGVASRRERTDLAAFLRPLGGETGPTGHFHAAAFSHRALPKGPISLNATLTAMFEGQSLLGVWHLLNDTRPIVGAGESLFVRGAVWAAPIGTVERAADGRETPGRSNAL